MKGIWEGGGKKESREWRKKGERSECSEGGGRSECRDRRWGVGGEWGGWNGKERECE